MEEEQLLDILFKNTNVNFLLGAGASYKKKANNFPLMKDLLQYVIDDKNVKMSYDSFKKNSLKDNDIAIMIVNLFDNYLYSDEGNIEKFLSVIEGADFYANNRQIVIKINKAKRIIKKVIKERILSSDIDSVIDVYLHFYEGLKCLKEVNGLKNQTFNIFTTNYDMMNEIAMERMNIHFYSGFEGIVNRKFNLSYYNYNFVDHFLYNKSQVRTIPNHINLFKLHGSLSWCYEEDQLVELNPFRIDFEPEIIYPSVEKFNNTNLIIDYSSLMREFSNRICNSNTTLFVSGMSMGDEHINKIVENALTLDSFHLVIFCATESLIEELKAKYNLYNNVIVISKVFTFDMVAKFMIDLSLEESV